MTNLVWHKYDANDAATCPKEPGTYAVMVAGDSESVDGMPVYEYPDYQTFASLNVAEDDGEATVLRGFHDEEPDWIFAWCGPIKIPAYDRNAAVGI